MKNPCENPPYYITTAILYANASPHVGHTFELIGADVMARAKRMLGYDVFFQTGTDEHGQKMLEYAERAGKDPKAYADEVAPRHKQLWDSLHISYDRFIRTTDPDHYASVEAFWKKTLESGDIYKGKYDGWYCVTDENFVLENQVVLKPDSPDKKFCPECQGELHWKSEESYFFRWSKYQQTVEKWLDDNRDFIAPEFRRNEMINSFLKPGLQDISISRTSIKWGIPVPGDPDHVIYVWFDALINYITGVGYNTDEERFNRYWPANVHVVGKDILKFHTLLWPAMCFAAGIEPPKRVFGHGFVSPKASVAEDGTVIKMSKSRGNVVDPLELLEKFGGNPDPLRFFLLREIDFGGDGFYSDEALEARYNADLADKIGNLLSRTLSMAEKYQGGQIRKPAEFTPEDQDAINTLLVLFQKDESGLSLYERLVDQSHLNQILEKIILGAQKLNLYITEQKPFSLAKDPAQAERLNAILYVLCEGLRVLATQLYPFIPSTSERIWAQLGAEGELASASFEKLSRWGYLDDGKVTRGENLFPKAEKA